MKKTNDKLIVLLILGLLVQQQPVNGFIGMILSVAQFAWSAFEMLNTAHDTYSKFTTPSTADLLEKSEQIAESLDNWGGRIEEKIQQSMDTLLTRLPLRAQISSDIDSLNFLIGRIDGLYADMKEYLTHPQYFSDIALDDMVKVFTSRDGGDVEATITDMHNLIVPQRLGKLKKSVFLLLAQESLEYEIELCGTGATPQQRLIEFYDVIIESEMRGFAMSGFGLLMKGYLENVSLIADIKRLEKKLLLRSEQYLITLKDAMYWSGTRFRLCDPPQGHERDVTFYEFVKFIQGFVVSEGALQEDNLCYDMCEGYTQPTPLYTGCNGFECDGEPTTCYGMLRDCKSMNYYADVCQNTHGDPRRYAWFKDGYGDVQGDDADGCSIVRRAKGGFWEGHTCDVCRCLCVDDAIASRSSHFISLREQISNVDDNMVITGLAFVMLNNILHIKIMQGKLAPNGEIFGNSTVWLEPEDIQFERRQSVRLIRQHIYKFIFVKKSNDTDDEEMIPDKDVAVLTWEERKINLDVMRLPQHYVLTGVRFRRMTEDKSILLEIQGTRFDAKTGQLKPGTSSWTTPYDMPYTKKKKERVVYKAEGLRNPLKSFDTKIDTKPFTSIEIDHTDYIWDAAQTVIPLLDALPVVSDPPTPLVGVGLYHKSQSGYGGFLTFVLDGLNQAPFVPTDI